MTHKPGSARPRRCRCQGSRAGGTVAYRFLAPNQSVLRSLIGQPWSTSLSAETDRPLTADRSPEGGKRTEKEGVGVRGGREGREGGRWIMRSEGKLGRVGGGEE